jgi:hypothetical protein
MAAQPTLTVVGGTDSVVEPSSRARRSVTDARETVVSTWVGAASGMVRSPMTLTHEAAAGEHPDVGGQRPAGGLQADGTVVVGGLGAGDVGAQVVQPLRIGEVQVHQRRRQRNGTGSPPCSSSMARRSVAIRRGVEVAKS